MHSLPHHVSPRKYPFSLYVSFNSAASQAPERLSAIRNLPQNVTVVPEIRRFFPVGSQFNEGQVELVDGTVSLVLHNLSAIVTRILDYFWTRPHYICDRFSIQLSIFIAVP